MASKPLRRGTPRRSRACVTCSTEPLPRRLLRTRYDRRMTDSSSTPTQAPADDTPEQVVADNEDLEDVFERITSHADAE